MFTLTIETDNAAFCDPDGDLTDPAPELAQRREVARILREVAHVLDIGCDSGDCRDANGNRVGAFMLDDSE